jgi:predicted ATPase
VIHSIRIQNFRCFSNVFIPSCQRLNVVVGDNGSGKTSLLEAIFLTLSGSLEVSVRLRAQRGNDGLFSGSSRHIEEAVWQGFFFDHDWVHDINIVLQGDGPESRSLKVTRSASQLTIPLNKSSNDAPFTTSPLSFIWTDCNGRSFSVSPAFGSTGLRIPATEEELLDFFHFPAGGVISSAETAGRFSEIRQARRDKKFVDAITSEYNWIEDISIEVSAGSPALFATLKGVSRRIPLADVSGGINRVAGLLAAMATREHSIVIVDEIETGLYHKHQAGLWRSLLAFAREFDCQMFVSTHSEEWLEALIEAAGDQVDDIALLRVEHASDGPVVRQFSGGLLKAGLETGGEVR